MKPPIAVDRHLEQVDAVTLVALRTVATLGLDGGIQRGVGGVVGARFADRFELAVEEGGPVASSVAEHALAVFDGEPSSRAG